MSPGTSAEAVGTGRLRTTPRARAAVLLACMAGVYLLLAGASTRALSVTVDEFAHLPVGHNVLTTGDFDYCRLNPPLMNVLSALPLQAMHLKGDGPVGPLGKNAGHDFWPNGYRFMDQYRSDYVRAFAAARLVTVLMGALLGLLVFAWAGLFAPEHPLRAGLLAAALVWFSPDLLAHAALVTTDTGAALSFAFALFTLHRLARDPTPGRALACGLGFGLAQLVKFTAIYLYPLALLLAWPLARRHHPLPARRIAAGLLLVLATSLLVINAGYLFQGSGRPLGGFTFNSGLLGALRAHLPGRLPVPLPAAFVQAFDQQLADTARGDPSYLLGFPYSGGRWYYFITLLALKTPVPLLLLALGAIAFRLRRSRELRDEDLLLLVPALVLLFVFSFFSNKQLGLRMILPAAPLFWLWVSAAVARDEPTRPRAAALALLLAWLGVEVARVQPDPLGYFNGLVPEPGGYPLAGDSNLDWGQGLVALSRYLHERGEGPIQLYYFGRVDPAIYGIDYVVPEHVQPGLVAISPTLFTRPYILYDHGKLVKQSRIKPVPENFHPIARLMHSVYLYRVDPPPASPAR